MNFSYLEHRSELAALYTACSEAEEFSLTKPDISATSARKAMEFIVKYIYSSVEPYPPYGYTVYDMISDTRFRNQFADPAILNSIDYIRKAGNAAVHKGNLTVEDAMCVLEHLHFLVGEFAVGIGLIQEYAEFIKPEPDVVGELLRNIHPDNLMLNLLPYVLAAAHEDWRAIMSGYGIKHIADMKDVPEELNHEAFRDFLSGFRQSMKAEVAGILELLPLDSATEKEWKERRSTVPKSSIARVECFVLAYIEDNQRAYTQKWTYYNEALGEKAAAYLQLVHPDYIPESMRSAYVKPDAAEVGEAEEYVSLEEAAKQILRYIVAENPRKRDLLSLSGWCKTNLSIASPVIRTSIGSDHPERGMYSKDKVHMGDKKFYVYLNWNRVSLLRLRQAAGEFGEMLITMDRLADWGFALPDSDAEKRAKERAERRNMLEAAEAERQKIEEERKSAIQEAARAEKAIEDPEASPREIRSFIECEINLVANIENLRSREWCREKLNFEYPVLIDYEEGVYLRRKQMDGNYTYSRIQMQYAGKTYFVLRMRISEFERFRRMMKK